jgi:hypothetical protein
MSPCVAQLAGTTSCGRNGYREPRQDHYHRTQRSRHSRSTFRSSSRAWLAQARQHVDHWWSQQCRMEGGSGSYRCRLSSCCRRALQCHPGRSGGCSRPNGIQDGDELPWVYRLRCIGLGQEINIASLLCENRLACAGGLPAARRAVVPWQRTGTTRGTL